MKYKYITLISVLITSLSYADVCSLPFGKKEGNTFNGPTTCGTGRLDTMVVNGPLKLDETKIKGTLTVNGPLNAQKASANILEIKGPSNIEHGQFKRINAHGPIILTDSKVDSILMPGPSRYDLEKICLIGKTTVGQITVKSGKGVIYKQDSATISSKPTGATVKKFDASEC